MWLSLVMLNVYFTGQATHYSDGLPSIAQLKGYMEPERTVIDFLDLPDAIFPYQELELDRHKLTRQDQVVYIDLTIKNVFHLRHVLWMAHGVHGNQSLLGAAVNSLFLHGNR